MADQDILFRLDVDESGAVRGFRVSRDELNKLKQTSQQTGAAATTGAQGVKRLGDASERTGRQADTSSVAMRRLQGIVAGIFTAATIRQAISYADTMKEIDARLRIVTDSTDEFVRAQEATFDIAQRTGVALETTTGLYTRLEQSLKTVGTAQDDILQVTETITQALIASGAGAQEANAAIIQLSQGFAAGALRGDEFRSVAEQAPVVLRALQESLGLTRGELKALADDGKLSTEIIVQALLEQSGAIQQEFDQMPVTVSRAMQVLRNEALKWVADADDAAEASAKIAESIVDLSQNLDEVAQVIGSVGVAALTAWAARAIAAGRATATLTLAVRALLGPIGLIATAVGAATFAFLEYRQRAAETAQSANDLADAITNASSRIAAADAIIATHEAIRTRRLEIESLREEVELLANAPDILTSFAAQAGVAITPDVTRVTEIRDRITELAAEIVEYQGTLDVARGKTDELTTSLGNQRSAVDLLKGSLGEVADIQKQVEAAMKTAESAVLEHGTTAQKVAIINRQYDAVLAELEKTLRQVAGAEDLLAQARVALGKAREEDIQAVIDETDAVVQLDRAINDLIGGALDPATVALSQLEVKLEEVEIQFGANSEEARRAREAVNQARLEYERLNETEIEVPDFNPFVKAIERGIERLDDTFADMWRNVFTGAENAFDAIKNLVLNTLAELAHAALTRPIVLSIAAAVGGTGANSVFASLGGVPGAGGGGFGLGGFASLFGGNSIGAGFAGLPPWLGGAGTNLGTMGPNYGIPQSGLFSGAGQYANWQYGLAGVGGYLFGDLLFGGQGGTGGSLGATIGLAAGGAPGAAIGTVLGSFVGSFFGQDRPSVLDVSGHSQAGESSSDLDRVFTSDLGQIFTRSRRVDEADIQQFGQSIVGFDNQLAQLLDAEQLAEATQRLQSWELHLEDEAITLEAYLEGRFAVVLSTFNDEIQQYVNEAEGLQAQFERLQLITGLEDLLEAVPELDVFGSLTEAAKAFEDLALAGEPLAQTFARVAASVQLLDRSLDLMGVSIGKTGAELVQFAADFTTAAGGVDRAAALWSSYFENFYAADEIIEARLGVANRNLVSELGDIGLEPGITGEQFRALFESVLPTLSADALVEWLEAGQALGLVIDLEQQLTAARLEGLTIEEALQRQIALVDELSNAYDGSAESQRRIISATATLADLMDDLRASFDATRDSVSAITGGAITDLRREGLSEEALFNELRAEALAKSAQLETAGSQAEVLALVREITQLATDAAGLADGAVNQEIIAFLQTVDQIAQLRLGDLENQAITQAQAEIDQVEAMFTFSDAVDTFAAAVGLVVGSDGKVPAGDTGPVEAGADLPVAVSDAIATGFDASGFVPAVGDFGAGVADFRAAARSINTQPPVVYVTTNITVDQQGNVLAQSSEVSLE